MRFMVTMTLRPAIYAYDATYQYDDTHESCVQTLVELCPSGKMVVVAELTQNANIHYHAIVEPGEGISQVKLNKRLRDLVRGPNSCWGHCTVSQVTDEPGAKEYLAKSISDTRELVGRPPILRDELDYYRDMSLSCHCTF